ncbi:MAG: tetratricopeptide repeat protein [SAR324 cluster bacterium]|nr:tetratricopeptide repeat protein [SAR324 cluster bacterium]
MKLSHICLIALLLLSACTSAEEIRIGSLQHFKRGNDLQERSHFKEAITEYQLAINYDDEQEVFHYNKGLCYFNLVLYQQSIDSYNRAIEINPEFPEAYYNLSLALNKMDRPDEAYIAYERYQKLNKKHLAAREKLAKKKEAPKVLSGPGKEEIQK